MFENLTIQPYGTELFNKGINEIPEKCALGNNAYSLECIYKMICPQFTKHFIRMGIIFIISYFIIIWLWWWFTHYGYKLTPDRNIQFFGNFHELNTRLYWDIWLRNRIINMFMLYTAMVVWFAINQF